MLIFVRNIYYDRLVSHEMHKRNRLYGYNNYGIFGKLLPYNNKMAGSLVLCFIFTAKRGSC